MPTSRPNIALVVGASGAIGQSMVQYFLEDSKSDEVVAISRHSNSASPDKLHWFHTDHSPESINRIIEQLTDLRSKLCRVVLCPGVLHGETFKPEKTLEQLDRDTMLHIFTTNTIVPMLWLQQLMPLLKGTEARVAVLSARVGSISDNCAGGWYSYRASKAALNMMLKSAAIEIRRRAPRVKLVAFHPGTTDSELSRPFQKNVQPEKLFAPGFVAARLGGLLDDAEADGELSYLDWAGEPIPW